MVSSCPYVRSGDFSFCFDTAELGTFGYVVPLWCEPHVIDEQIPQAYKTHADGTILWLPYGTDKEPLKDVFVDPKVLLFLRNLKRICVDQLGVKHIFQSRELEVSEHHGIKRLGLDYFKGDSTTITTNYVLYSFGVAKDGSVRLNGDDLTLAFPLLDEGEDQRSKQMVYSFLPVCCVGLPFIVHGTFELVSNRKQLHHSEKNETLRDAIGQAFAYAVEADEEVRKRLWAFVPKITEVTDPFWAPVVADITRNLGSIGCVYTESHDWIKPSDAFLRPSNLPRCIISSEELLSVLGAEFAEGSSHELQGLGIRKFSLLHMFDYLSHVGPRVLLSKPDQWFIDVYR